jgi:hypothetical protein
LTIKIYKSIQKIIKPTKKSNLQKFQTQKKNQAKTAKIQSKLTPNQPTQNPNKMATFNHQKGTTTCTRKKTIINWSHPKIGWRQ